MGEQKIWMDTAESVTLDGLPEFIRNLMNDYHHDYGTIVHAINAGMIATFNAMNRDPGAHGGITGFQASCLVWPIIRKFVGISGPARIVQYDKLLYPQYEYDFTQLSGETWVWLKKEAQKKIDEGGDTVAPEVFEHWKSIVAGDVPFGFIINNED